METPTPWDPNLWLLLLGASWVCISGIGSFQQTTALVSVSKFFIYSFLLQTLKLNYRIWKHLFNMYLLYCIKKLQVTVLIGTVFLIIILFKKMILIRYIARALVFEVQKKERLFERYELFKRATIWWLTVLRNRRNNRF